jgi:hypothetical protein
MAIGAKNNNIDSIPADKRTLTAIALIRASLCLVLKRILQGVVRADWLFDQELPRQWQQTMWFTAE